MLKNLGFSLLELLIVLAIISILGMVTYPTYTHHIAKTHRKQAEMVLFDLANRIERYYLENNHSYANATTTKLNIDKTTLENFYEITIPVATATTYSLQATPTGKQAEHDSRCGSLILNQLGERKISGNGNINECW